MCRSSLVLPGAARMLRTIAIGSCWLALTESRQPVPDGGSACCFADRLAGGALPCTSCVQAKNGATQAHTGVWAGVRALAAFVVFHARRVKGVNSLCGPGAQVVPEQQGA